MSSQPHNSAHATAHPSPDGSQAPEYSPEERRFLLKTAHESIEAAVEKRKISFDCPSSHLSEPRGVFTTIYLGGALRGCVGYVFPSTPLYLGVSETARAAALEDTRFQPVMPYEANALEVSLSILSPITPIAPEHVEIGRHGLLVSMAGHRGLLLPQVPVEHHWDRVTFLEQTCRKAGLPTNAWRIGATLEAFTAEVFGDAETST